MPKQKKGSRQYELHTFPNGLRWVHLQSSHTELMHIGIMHDIGSRDEQPEIKGITHFWEHMAFKGTSKHNANFILNRIDSVGGDLNAYTTKEKICFYTTVLKKYTDRALQLLFEISFDAVFPDQELEKEKQVVLEEMAMYEDNPEDAIQDQFDAQVFGNHALSWNILGTQETVKSFRKSMLLDYIKQHQSTRHTVISTVGNMPSSMLLKKIEKYAIQIPDKNLIFKRQKPQVVATSTKQVEKPISQAHCMIGREAYDLHHPNRLSFFILSNYLGGHAMNARLNIALREKKGFVYHVDSNFATYSDTGIFTIYFGTDAKYVSKALALIETELNSLLKKPLSHSALRKIKEQVKGQLAISEENNNGLMLLLAKNILDLGYVDSLPTIFNKIDDISTQHLFEVANEMLDFKSFSTLLFLPDSNHKK